MSRSRQEYRYESEEGRGSTLIGSACYLDCESPSWTIDRQLEWWEPPADTVLVEDSMGVSHGSRGLGECGQGFYPVGSVSKITDLSNNDRTPIILRALCNAASASGDWGSDSSTSRPITPAPLSAILFISRPRSARDQGHRPYCRKLSSSIKTGTTSERCAGGGARRKNESASRSSESRTTGMTEKATTRLSTSSDSANRQPTSPGEDCALSFSERLQD